MDRADESGPITKPSLNYFKPYRETIIGFIVVALIVALLVAGVQLLVGV
jgi:uncharacterized protein YhhL (DUF1145 family)